MDYTYNYRCTKPDKLKIALYELCCVCKIHKSKMIPTTTTFKVDIQPEGNVYITTMEYNIMHKKECVLLKMTEWFYSFSKELVNEKTRGNSIVCICVESDSDLPNFIIKLLNTLNNILKHNYNECDREYELKYYWENPYYYEYSTITYSSEVSNRKIYTTNQ